MYLDGVLRVLSAFRAIIGVPLIIIPDSSPRAFQRGVLALVWRIFYSLCGCTIFIRSDGFVSDGCARAHPLGVAPVATKEWLTPLGS
jgi:hypothetical protein